MTDPKDPPGLKYVLECLKKSADSSKSPASGFVRSRPRPCVNFGTPAAATSSRASSIRYKYGVGRRPGTVFVFGPLAHAWLEQRTHNPLVPSSTLGGPTNPSRHS